MKPNATDLTRGYPIALLSAAILSLTAILIRYLTQTYQMPALVLACWRDSFVALTLLIVLGMIKPSLLRAGRRHLPYLVAYGFALAVFNSLWTLSVALNGAAVSTVLAYCSAGFTALLGYWFLKERLDAMKILAVVISLAGCVLVSQALDPAAWIANLLGIFTGLLSGLFYAIYTIFGRSAGQRGLNPWTTLLYSFGGAAIFLFLFNLLPGVHLPGAINRPADFFWLGDAYAGWGVLFLLAAGPTVLGFGCYNISLLYLPSSVANLIMTLEPVFTALVAFAFLGERMTWVQLMGGLLILAGVIVLRISENRYARGVQAENPSMVS